MPESQLRDAVSRLVDLAVVVPALGALAPVMGGVACAIAATMGRPVLFRQERAGLHGKPFRVVKFRTMRDLRPGEAEGTSDGDRTTRLGRFLRATSLDELPTLVNVLRGDMALVGPRPLPIRYLARYDARQARRHEVKPGITCLAQVRGRNALTWEEKFELDVRYVDHRSLALDLRILAETVAVVLRREGIAHEGHATMPEFTGSNGAS